jgi:hypothetical protein
MRARIVLFLALGSTVLPIFALGPVAAAQPDPAVGPVVIQLADPVYPPIARAAHVNGEVVVVAEIRADGSVVSVRVDSGPPMLHQAAIDSSSHSTFECRGCVEGEQEYRIVYSFKFIDEGDCCEGYSKPSSFKRLPEAAGEHTTEVLVMAHSICLCDPAATTTSIKARSVKCLWLWKCSARTN